MATKYQSQIKASAKYNKANVRQIGLALNMKKDQDIFDHLDKKPSKQKYLKDLIREDIQRSER